MTQVGSTYYSREMTPLKSGFTKTERFSYLVYSWQYGIELKPFVGKVMGVDERYSELRRVITECLMVNPYIKSIDSFVFAPENHGELVRVHITLATVYGEMEIDV